MAVIKWPLYTIMSVTDSFIEALDGASHSSLNRSPRQGISTPDMGSLVIYLSRPETGRMNFDSDTDSFLPFVCMMDFSIATKV